MNTDITLIRYATEVVGEGPTLHVHPYDEIFTIIEGRARFTVGDKTIDAAVGDVVLGPANILHGYQNLGPGKLDSLDIHLSPEGIQDNLADGWDKSSIFISADSKVSPAGASKQNKKRALTPRSQSINLLPWLLEQRFWSPRRQSRQHWQLSEIYPKPTRSPILTFLTEGPVAIIRPQTSWPRTKG